MLTQRNEIIRAMSERGWRVVDVEELPGEWWRDEFLEFESDWSPVGARVFLTFLVDPQHDRLRRKGEAVWAVVASPERPEDPTVEGPNLSLGQGWQDRLSAFVAELEHFRKLDRS